MPQCERKLAIALVLAAAFAAVALAATTWEVPATDEAAKNPFPADKDNVAAGKDIYTHNCVACHGKSGKGNGPAASALKTKPHDLSSPDIWRYSDGNLYYKITEGRLPMPSYRKTLSEKQRWQSVDYIRTFAPKPAPG